MSKTTSATHKGHSQISSAPLISSPPRRSRVITALETGEPGLNSEKDHDALPDTLDRPAAQLLQPNHGVDILRDALTRRQRREREPSPRSSRPSSAAISSQLLTPPRSLTPLILADHELPYDATAETTLRIARARLSCPRTPRPESIASVFSLSIVGSNRISDELANMYLTSSTDGTSACSEDDFSPKATPEALVTDRTVEAEQSTSKRSSKRIFGVVKAKSSSSREGAKRSSRVVGIDGRPKPKRPSRRLEERWEEIQRGSEERKRAMRRFL